jgi:hypothetical protein
MVPLFNEFGEKELNLVLEICHEQGRSRSPSIYSLAKQSGAADEY